jgi:ATP-dependent Clp protease ATP-binding subunit ClpC
MKIVIFFLLLISPWLQDVSEAFSLAGTVTKPNLSSSSTSSPWTSHRGSFVSSTGRLLLHAKPSSSRSSSSFSLSMVFDRMSNDCVAAVKEAHDLGNSLGLDTLRTEILFAGAVAKPERAAQTLKKYDFDFEGVKEAVIKTLTYKTNVKMEGPNATKDPLPFSEDSRAILNKALQIAERQESSTVRTEHVLLALMGYNNGKPIEDVPVLEVLGDIPALKKGEASFTVTKFCEDLVNALPMTPIASADDDLVIREQVVIGGAGGNTNTLSEVGVDLTQMALEGKLDLVFGRDKEIRSALRTLGRRRKNNPCLIGDPGKFRGNARLPTE